MVADTGLVAYNGKKRWIYMCVRRPEQMRNSFSLDAKQKYYVFISESLSNEAQYEMRFEWDHNKSLINNFAQSYAFLSYDTIALHIFYFMVIVQWIKERKKKKKIQKIKRCAFCENFYLTKIVYRFGWYFRKKFHVRLPAVLRVNINFFLFVSLIAIRFIDCISGMKLKLLWFGVCVCSIFQSPLFNFCHIIWDFGEVNNNDRIKAHYYKLL